MGAFVSYDALQNYRDFRIALEPAGICGDGSEDRRVGLWAKQFMSDPDDKMKYLGTLTTSRLYRSVVEDSLPVLAPLTSRVAKVSKERDRLKAAHKLSAGKFCAQFTPARMADTIAMLSHDWASFRSAPRRGLWDLPHQLAERMGRTPGAVGAAGAVEAIDPPAPLPFADVLQLGAPGPMRQVAHGLANACGIIRGPGVAVSHLGVCIPKSQPGVGL
jgi:hypothetical protein